jgi:hypothetical protein
MTQEDKELLLKDLSARLFYGVKVSLHHEDMGDLTGTLDAIYPTEDRVIVDNLNKAIAPVNVRYGGFNIEKNNVKPYLRPMSSMTEEEFFEYNYIRYSEVKCKDKWKRIDVGKFHNIGIIPIDGYLDWLNAHHFDYRGLIDKGLAIEAPEGMYNIKE